MSSSMNQFHQCSYIFGDYWNAYSVQLQSHSPTWSTQSFEGISKCTGIAGVCCLSYGIVINGPSPIFFLLEKLKGDIHAPLRCVTYIIRCFGKRWGLRVHMGSFGGHQTRGATCILEWFSPVCVKRRWYSSIVRDIWGVRKTRSDWSKWGVVEETVPARISVIWRGHCWPLTSIRDSLASRWRMGCIVLWGSSPVYRQVAISPCVLACQYWTWNTCVLLKTQRSATRCGGHKGWTLTST